MFTLEADITRIRLGKQLRNARKKQKKSLKDISFYTRRNIARLSEMETGKSNYSIDNLIDFANLFGLDVVLVPRYNVNDALEWSGNRPPPQPQKSVLEEYMINMGEGDDIM